MGIELFDTHCHLDDEQIVDDLEGILERAKAAEVTRMTVVGCDELSSDNAVALSREYNNIFGAVGVHPSDSDTWNKALMEKIGNYLQLPKIVALGEIGLDYHYDDTDRDTQKRVFIEQVHLAQDLHKPIIIHDRDAHEDVWKILKQEKAGKDGGIIHCFSGSYEFAKEMMRLGFNISFSGSVTFKNAHKLQAVAEQIPMDYLLVETDSPYLSPHPERGKLNEPARVRLVAEKIAELKKCELEEIAAITTENALRVYNIR